MTTKRRGICPVCDREFDVTKAGVMRMHGAVTKYLMNCAGVGQPPAHAFPDPLVAAEERGYRRAVQALRDEAAASVIFESSRLNDHESAVVAKALADHLESLAAAPRNEGAQT